MKRILLATVSLVAMTSGVRAADMPTKMPLYEPLPTVDWAGAYVGIQGGIVRRDAAMKFSPELDFGDGPGGSKTGGAVGLSLGYNWHQGRFVYGLEGDLSWIGAKTSHIGAGLLSTSNIMNWMATLRGRAGLAIESTLFYLTGGGAFVRVKNSNAFLNSNGSVSFSFVQDQTKTGWTIGAGVEHILAPQWMVRGELRYIDLGKTSVACAAGTEVCTSFLPAHGIFSNAVTMGLVGLSYKFESNRPADPRSAYAYSPPPTAHWSGAYLGVQGGLARHNGSFSDVDCFLGCGFLDRTKTGGTVGGLVGYNWQRGGFVYGLEGDWNWINAKTNRFFPNFNPADRSDLSTSYNVNWLATVRGRAGLSSDSMLLYVTGGIAFGHVKNSVDVLSANPLNLGTPLAAFTQKQTKIGWTAGVGAEYMLARHWTARAEVRYVDLGKTSIACQSAIDFNDCTGLGYRGEFSNTLVQGLVGLAYKF